MVLVLYSAYASTPPRGNSRFYWSAQFCRWPCIQKGFRPKIECKEELTIQELEPHVDNIKEWMDPNRLNMNRKKTEVILFGSAKMLPYCSINTMNINGEQVTIVLVIKWLDVYLTMKDHINVKCKSAMFNLSRLKWIRPCNTLVMGLVISDLHHANSILAGLPEVDLSKLQRVQNMAAKIICDKGHYDSVTECMYGLYYFPICRRIQHRQLTQVYKCIAGEAPGYLQELISENKPGRVDLHSGSAYCQLVVPHMKCKKIADRSFIVQDPAF